MQNLDCRFCQKTFYKPEHLKRHERSHTGSKPFVCQICKRPFARQDSLQRHERLHNRQKLSAYASPSPSTDTQASQSEDSINVDSPSYVNGTVAVSEVAPAVEHQSTAQTPTSFVEPSSNHQSFQPISDAELIWPDSEDLFQTLLGSNPDDQWHMTLNSMLSNPPLLSPQNISSPSSTRFGDQPRSIDSIPVDGNHRAVYGVSNMIHVQSSSVTAAVNSCSINSMFLDECLHMFFVRFIPTLPILHRPTFVFRDCLHPLLLNAIAIGSLYLGHKDAVAKGEVLWRLAHTALATVWQSMMSHQGPYDSRPGLQLLITALLGQIYGSLSKNSTIRVTSQAFHTMTFFWARQCGMLDVQNSQSNVVPTVFASEEDKNIFWKRWVSQEIEKRTLLAHYALQGLIARMSGEATSERNLINRLPMPHADAAFSANTCDEFVFHLRSYQDDGGNFRQVLQQLSSSNDLGWTPQQFSSFSLTVLLEGIQAKISDLREDHEFSPIPAMSLALAKTYDVINGPSSLLSNAERLEALLRWHSVCLESIINTSALCKHLCREHNIQQNLWSNSKIPHNPPNLQNWAQGNDSRKALLHAIAIQDIIEELPRGRAHAIHMPAALFSASTICTVFCLVGRTTVNLPNIVNWNDVVQYQSGMEEQTLDNETRRFIRGDFDSSTATFGAFRNLPYEFNSVQKLFRCLATQWGVAIDMETIVREWKVLFR